MHQPTLRSKYMSSNGNYVTTNELSQFKSDLLKEICAITPQPQPHHSQPEPLVNILLKHIDFLQSTITALVHKIEAPQFKPPAATNSFAPPPTTAAFIVAAPIVAAQAVAAQAVTAPAVAAPAVAVPAIAATLATPATGQQPNPSTSGAVSAVPATTPIPTRKPFNKKQVLIVGDSMLNCIDEKDMRRSAFVRVRNHPGATVEDLEDHVRAHTRHVKHDGFIVMAGTNDISINQHSDNKGKPKRDTGAHMQQLIKQIKECSPDAHIAICQVTSRKDSKGAMKEVTELNQTFKQLAQREKIGFVNTSHFEPRHTGAKGVHPTDNGIDILFETLEKYVHKISRL